MHKGVALWQSTQKPLPVILAPQWVSSAVPAALLPIKLPASGLGKAAENGSSVWVPATHMENRKYVPGS